MSLSVQVTMIKNKQRGELSTAVTQMVIKPNIACYNKKL